MGARPLVVVNQSSGTALVPDEALRLFPDAELVDCETEDASARIAGRLPDEPAFVAVAGGDGTQRMVAGCLAGTGVPMLPVPTGTLNHFARQLGIETVDDSVRAARGRSRRTVDVGDVNGEVFVNNSSLGQYPAFVRARDEVGRRWPRVVASIMAAWRQLARNHRLRVSVGGTPYQAWLVFVGNNRYELDVFRLVERASLNETLLDVRVLRADRRLARLRAAAALGLGRAHRSALLVRQECAATKVVLGADEVEVALDGDVVKLRPPLRYRIRPGALAVLVPPAVSDPMERDRGTARHASSP